MYPSVPFVKQIRNTRTVQLGSALASAGEGTIYEVVGSPELVAKIFHPDLKDLAVKMAKVGAMTASPPDGVVQSDGFVVLTWPSDLCNDGAGAMGYLMPRIDTSNAVEIHTVSNPSNRANPLPTAPVWPRNVTWSHLVNVAANLCLAVEIVHRVNAVIGDFQERNILVNDTTRVTLVDCDSMQYIDEAGHQYPCGVARPEFTAPELAGADLAVTARSKPSDLFALAVHIHLLLMAGNHPYLRGEWTGGGEQPDALTLAASGQWAGGPGSALRTHPLAPPVSFLPHDIQHLFVRAFTEGARNPDARPTAAQWRGALVGLQLRTCPRGHQIPIEADSCPWCVIDDQRAARRSARAASSSGSSGNRTDQVVYRVDSPGLTPPPASAAVPYPAQSGNRNNRNVVIVLGIAAVAVIALLLVFLIPFGNRSGTGTASPTTAQVDTRPAWITSTTAATMTTTRRSGVPPHNAKPCDDHGVGMYRSAAAGTLITSCPFAMSVRDAVNDTHQVAPRTVNAYSPVTNKWYPMTCVMEDVLTCRGGNDAVVYVY
ncbi:protein kinase [Mycobacterium sp. DSM 3803]|nr:protein kinase [Mycobacterium sp. DSM 3803]